MSTPTAYFGKAKSTFSKAELRRQHLGQAAESGLHFDGAAGNIDIASPPDLGTKFSFEFIVQADVFGAVEATLIDFGNGGRFFFGAHTNTSFNLGFHDNASWKSFGVKVLDDLKVHHLTVTIDGTAAILYDNANQVATLTISASHAIDSCTDAAIAAIYTGGGTFFDGTMYRARLFNRTLSASDVVSLFENASVPTADRWGAPAVGGANDKVEGDFTYNLDGWDAVNSWNSQTNPAANMVLAANATGQHCRNASTIVVGYSYRCFYTASATAGAPAFGYHNGSAVVALPATGSGTSTISNSSGTQNTFDFVLPATATGAPYVYIVSTTASDAVTIDDIHVIQTGAVSDYELSANPTQSLMVADRANAADGLASATGISQVSPLVQLNATAARIGTSAATPADGDLLVSGAIGINCDPIYPLELKRSDAGLLRAKIGHVGTASADDAALQLQTGGATSGDPKLMFKTGVTDWSLGIDNSDGDSFKIAKHDNPGSVTRLTIDTDGNAGFQTTPKAWNSAFNAIQVGESAVLSGRSSTAQCRLGNNWYYDAVGDKRIVSGLASQYIQTSLGHHEFFTAATGAADSVITFGAAKFTIANTGLATFANGIALDNSAGVGYIAGSASIVTVADASTTTVDISGGALVQVYVNGTGGAGLFYAIWGSSTVTELSDVLGWFGTSAGADDYNVYKASGTHLLTIENNIGSSRGFRIMVQRLST